MKNLISALLIGATILLSAAAVFADSVQIKYRKPMTKVAPVGQKEFNVDSIKERIESLVAEDRLTREQANEILIKVNHVSCYEEIRNIPPEERAIKIDELVEEGKITREIADEMLVKIKSNEALQEVKNLTPEQRQARLDELVLEGTITKEQADEFLNKITKTKNR